jgi:hypothetical protein
MNPDEPFIASLLCGTHEVSGSFTHTCTPEDGVGFTPEEMCFTIWVNHRIVWWKRPWYWLHRKPTEHTTKINNARVGELTHRADGTISYEFTGEGIVKSPLLQIPRPRSTSCIRARPCRGEDSNLCFSGERNLTVGAPLRDGLQQLAIVGLLVSIAVLVPWLVIYPAAIWADVAAATWCVAQWRAM